uniref:Uncharacterized protein n=1 Tax=Oryza punctata TaxID=4537 RepID=A0A0E0MML5_ORYPU
MTAYTPTIYFFNMHFYKITSFNLQPELLQPELDLMADPNEGTIFDIINQGSQYVGNEEIDDGSQFLNLECEEEQVNTGELITWSPSSQSPPLPLLARRPIPSSLMNHPNLSGNFLTGTIPPGLL